MWGMQWEKWKNGGGIESIYGKRIEVRLKEVISRGGGSYTAA